MFESLRRLPTRLTVVLVLAAGLALALAGLQGPGPSTSAPVAEATEDALLDDVAPEVVAAAVDRVTAIDEPLTVWLQIADCESGEWDAEAEPKPGSARWEYGTQRSTRFEGGLHFAPQTWDAHRDPSMPGHAGEAAPVAQIVVAERVLDAQGWEAWPVCSRKVGAR